MTMSERTSNLVAQGWVCYAAGARPGCTSRREAGSLRSQRAAEAAAMDRPCPLRQGAQADAAVPCPAQPARSSPTRG